MESVYLHDPCALVAAVRPDLFTWHAGAVVVAETGALRGKTLLDGALPAAGKTAVRLLWRRPPLSTTPLLERPRCCNAPPPRAVSCKKWIGDNAWLHRPKVQVAMGAQADAVSALCLRLMCA